MTDSRFAEPFVTRFFERFEVKSSGCWEWWWGLTSAGYGRFWDGQRQIGSHVWSYEYHNKVIVPKGMEVMHSCDNPACVNPNHLSLGTTKDNAQDRVKKGRGARGQRNGSAVVTDKEAERIIRLLNARMKREHICTTIGCSKYTVGKIAQGVSYKHLPRGEQIRRRRRQSGLSNKQARYVIRLLNSGMKRKEVKELVGCSEYIVGCIARNETFKHLPREG